MRKIHFGEEVWEYTIGKRFFRIKSPNGAARDISYETMVNFIAPDKLEVFLREEWQPVWEPSDVRKYIEAHHNLFVAPIKKKRSPLTRPRR